jgi:hypothetical protein
MNPKGETQAKMEGSSRKSIITPRMHEAATRMTVSKGGGDWMFAVEFRSRRSACGLLLRSQNFAFLMPQQKLPQLHRRLKRVMLDQRGK